MFVVFQFQLIGSMIQADIHTRDLAERNPRRLGVIRCAEPVGIAGNRQGWFWAPSDEINGNKIDAAVWGRRFDTVQIKKVVLR
jgi:hypothetical protein